MASEKENSYSNKKDNNEFKTAKILFYIMLNTFVEDPGEIKFDDNFTEAKI